jgi:DNA-binding XRE family transcriptional regulator
VSFSLPKPKTMSKDEVVLSREDWESIVAILGEPTDGHEISEDDGDVAAVTAARAEDRDFASLVEAQRGTSVEATIPLDIIKAKLAGTQPVRAWRNHRDWTQTDLAFRSGVGRDLIAQIETRRKAGSVETLERLARALRVPMEALFESIAADR